MIKAEINIMKKSVDSVELDGSTYVLACEAALLVRTAYAALSKADKRSGENFRKYFKQLEGAGTVWDTKPIGKNEGMTPTPGIPVQ